AASSPSVSNHRLGTIFCSIPGSSRMGGYCTYRRPADTKLIGGAPNMITSLDFVAVPSQDAERTRAFYVDTLGLRPDEHARFEFWAGDTCFGIWEPDKMGR